MKNFKKLALIALAAIFVVSCSDDDTPAQNNSIAAVAARTAETSSLVSALTRADLVSVLDGDGSGPFTVFAPNNAAFATFLTQAGFASVNDVPVPVLREILLNHVLSGTVLSTQLSTGYVKTLGKGAASSTNTLSMYVNLTNGVFLNGAEMDLLSTDIACSNGVIHLIDTVIPMPTVVTHAAANSSFTTLVGLLSDRGLVSTLDGTASSPFTVFAPDNAAFTAFETENPGVLASLTPEQVTAVLTYHVVPGANVLSTGIPTGPITTFESGTFSITGTTITDEAGRMINIVVTDVQGTNGIIHVINKVLLPQL